MTTGNPPGSAVALAIVEVMKAVPKIAETGENRHANYKYASDEDLLRAIQPAMTAAGLCLIPVDIQPLTLQDKRADLLVTWKALHVSGEFELVKSIGSADLGQGKAVFAAMTGAIKYLLRPLFMVPTGDDPDKDAPQSRGKGSSDSRKPAAGSAQGGTTADANKGTPAQNKPGHHPSFTAKERAAFCAALDREGFKYETVAAMCESIKRPRPSAMDIAQRRALFDWLITDDGREKYAEQSWGSSSEGGGYGD